MPVERERRSGWEGERERRAQKPNPNKYFLPLENERGGWRKSQKKEEEGGPDSEEFMLVWWRPRSNGELSIHSGHGWTRLDDSNPSQVPFLRCGKETLRVTVTWSRLYSVNVKLHWEVWWIMAPWCLKDPSPPIHCAQTLALFVFQRFMLTLQGWHFSPRTLEKVKTADKP